MTPIPGVSTAAASVRCLESLEEGVAAGAWGGRKSPRTARGGRILWKRQVCVNKWLWHSPDCRAQFCLF